MWLILMFRWKGYFSDERSIDVQSNIANPFYLYQWNLNSVYITYFAIDSTTFGIIMIDSVMCRSLFKGKNAFENLLSGNIIVTQPLQRRIAEI